MAWLDLSGERFRVEVDGPATAPALVLSHALGAHLGMWDDVLPHLSPRRRIVRYDARGHGGSAAPDQAYGMGDLGRDLLGILDRLGLERVDFCGLSLGGMVGQWLALNAPQRLGKAVLANTTSYAGPARAWEGRIRQVRRHGLAPLADGVIDSWFSPAFRARAPQRVEEVRQMVLATTPAGYGGTSAAMRDMDFRPVLKSIATPVLVIVSNEDKATPPSWGEQVANSIPGARLARLDGGHLSAIEQPEAFAQAVEEFLG